MHIGWSHNVTNEELYTKVNQIEIYSSKWSGRMDDGWTIKLVSSSYGWEWSGSGFAMW